MDSICTGDVRVASEAQLRPFTSQGLDEGLIQRQYGTAKFVIGERAGV